MTPYGVIKPRKVWEHSGERFNSFGTGTVGLGEGDRVIRCPTQDTFEGGEFPRAAGANQNGPSKRGHLGTLALKIA